MSTSQKIVWGVSTVIVVATLLFVLRFVQATNNEISSQVEATATQTVFDVVELNSQKDFEMTGKQILQGGGFEPGWSFKLNIAGQKFGIELLSKYGETKYVGFLDLAGQSTSTKVWGGFVLDKGDQKQSIGIRVETKKCTEPSGDETDYTVKVLVGNGIEDLIGCAKIAN